VDVEVEVEAAANWQLSEFHTCATFLAACQKLPRINSLSLSLSLPLSLTLPLSLSLFIVGKEDELLGSFHSISMLLLLPSLRVASSK